MRSTGKTKMQKKERMGSQRKGNDIPILYIVVHYGWRIVEERRGDKAKGECDGMLLGSQSRNGHGAAEQYQLYNESTWYR